MPIVQANGININYEVQGEGEPLVLIPYLAADQACYAVTILFEECSHAPIYGNVEEFNRSTLACLQEHAG
jgi:hypothetical protein